MMHSIAGKATAWTMGIFAAIVVSGVANVGEAASAAATTEIVTYQVVTNEIEAKAEDGTQREIYRFDPAVFVANQGDDVVLKIHGVKGHSHPVTLEGYGLHGVIERNQTLMLHVHADRPGMFRLICTTHADLAHEGPMEGYLIVVPRTNP
jgi:plastocyanin